MHTKRLPVRKADRHSVFCGRQTWRGLRALCVGTSATLCFSIPTVTQAQQRNSEVARRSTSVVSDTITTSSRRNASTSKARTRRDSADYVRAKIEAVRSTGFRVVISLFERTLWVVSDTDTIRTATVAVGKGDAIEANGKRWEFHTPRGRRTVLTKESTPIWIPPEWHYVEVAKEHGLAVAHLSAKEPRKLQDGRALAVKDSLVGIILDDSSFAELPVDEEIVFDDTLYIPPVGTKNRMIEGELGKFRLDLGGGYLLHGTPYVESIGRAATHGCIRLHDEDIEWLYDNVPIGTPVYIY
jgi:hypothetical protein